MSREDIPNVLIRLTNVMGYNHSQESNLAFKAATDEIERLLANERKGVREVCAVLAGKTLVEELTPQKIIRIVMEQIRQLDLKLDEGGEEKI